MISRATAAGIGALVISARISAVIASSWSALEKSMRPKKQLDFP